MIPYLRTLLVEPEHLAQIDENIKEWNPTIEKPSVVLFSDSVTFDNGDHIKIVCHMWGNKPVTESVYTNYAGTFSSTKNRQGNCVRGLHQHEHDGKVFKVWVAGRKVLKRYAVIKCEVEVSDTEVPFLDYQADPDDISSDCDYSLHYEDKSTGMKVSETELIDWDQERPLFILNFGEASDQ
jgi:hypothetical protein